MSGVKNRRVLVTGASSGLGMQFARTFARQGASVVVAARRADRLAGLVDEIRAAGGIAHAVPLDVESEDSIIAAYDEAERLVGGIDTVLNNAGMNATGLSIDIPIADFDRVFAVNSRGVFLVAREAARRSMLAARASDLRIINIASMAAFHVIAGAVAYNGSKASVVMMTKSLAREWARQGINVNAICPGYIETEINSDWLADEGGKKMVARFPRRRVMPIDALDGIALYLASSASAHVTGGVFPIDDGQPL
jgi:NAD(P)-dependent dehydrogenase (short-subunit alcohol dehydrogenase family)